MAMYNSHLIYLFTIISIIFNKLAICYKDEDFGGSSLCMGNFTTSRNSSYQVYDNNVLSLLSELALKTDPLMPWFFTTSVGSTRQKAYGSYMCWGDINPELCQECVSHSTGALSKNDLYQTCFGFEQYLDSSLCLISYSNKSVIEYQEGYVMNMGCDASGKVANYLPYNRTLSTSIEGLIEEAAFGNWSRTNFQTRVIPVLGSSEKIHILVQCVPVISAKNCSRCLREVYDYVPKICNGSREGMITHANCILKFDNQSFIGGSYPSSSPNNLYVFSVMLFFLCFVTCI